MHFLSIAAVVVGFTVSSFVHALPGDVFKRKGEDTCLSAVIASGIQPFPSKAAADCSSFLQYTVTASARTITTTRTSTATATSAVTITKTRDSTVTAFNTVTDVITVTAVFTDLETETVSTSLTATLTVASTSTVTVTILSTTTDDSAFAKLKRTVAKADKILPPPTSTFKPTKIPCYARKPCTDTVHYSSACSCIGVVPTIVTVTPAASTTTVTVTSTKIPAAGHVTLSETLTVVRTATVSSTATIPTTITKVETFTEIVTLVETVTTPVVATATTVSVVTVRSRSNNLLVVDNNSGYRFAMQAVDGGGAVVVEEQNGNLEFYIDYASGHVIVAASPTFHLALASETGHDQVVFSEDDASAITCTITNPPTGGGLRCLGPASQSAFQLCPDEDRNLYVYLGTNRLTGCSLFQAGAIPPST